MRGSVENTGEIPSRQLTGCDAGPRSIPVFCHQRKMRDKEAEGDPRQPDTEINYTIEKIDADEANAFILRYEWLGTPGHPIARYCARDPNHNVAAVALFGKPHAQSASITRKIDTHYIKANGALAAEDRAYMDTVVCLERGACSHWAHPHTGSWFIPRVLKLAHAEYGWKTFYAYSDIEAGEIGTIYQACGWFYTGQGSGRKKANGKERERWLGMHPAYTKGKWITSRALYKWLRKFDLTIRDVRAGVSGWQYREAPAKHKYVQFVCDTKAERRALIQAMRRPCLPYPKRKVDMPDGIM